jgi:Ca2+-binding RTX toxin-like protein
VRTAGAASRAAVRAGGRCRHHSQAAWAPVNLATGTATDGAGGADTLSNIGVVLGSAFADTLTADKYGSIFFGGAGNDALTGDEGNYVLIGGAGRDTMTGLLIGGDAAAGLTVAKLREIGGV